MLSEMNNSDFAFLKNVQQAPKKERQPWSNDEDQSLIKLVEQYGQGKWTLVAKQLGTGRTGLQCRQRYLAKLDPSIKEGPWTEDEDRRIVAAQSKLGNRWQEITKYLEGRCVYCVCV
jgi:myb proto-oncogene protein